MKPQVTVLMSVYNGEKYLREAIDSILKQSFKNFEFLIINDGSNDGSEEIIKSYSDKRIRLVNNKKNIKLIKSLNKGIRLAKGKYIARMDADDISSQDRLEKEYDFLEANVSYVMVGSSALIMDESGNSVGEQKMITENDSIRKIMLVTNSFFHGSVMMRRSSVIKAGLYDPSSYVVEDYDLWSRMMDLGKVANIDENLYRYRLNPNGESFLKRKEQSTNTAKVSGQIWLKESLDDCDWKLIWPKFKEGLDSKQIRFYQYLHVQFAKKFRQKGDLIKSLKHILGAIKWVPFSLSPYFYFLMFVLPVSIFEKVEDYLIYNLYLKKNY